MTTTVVNVSDPFDEYIGRRKGTNEHFGNPFVEGLHGNREQVIEMFRIWLNGTGYLDIEPERKQWILANMHRLKDKRIGCHCKPLACHGDVYVEMLDRTVIDNFRGDYACFSNFSPHKVTYNKFTYKRSEHAFQAQKATNKKDHDYVACADSPVDAKRRGNEIECRPDFKEKKVGIMAVIVHHKFDQNVNPRQVLLNTGSALLIEGNWWHDDFWGMVKNDAGIWVGENNLGEILMIVRECLSLL